MSFNYDNASIELFNSEVNKIPEPYRTKFVQIVQASQKKLEDETYTGDAGAGLVKLTVDSKGNIKKLDIDKTLFEQNSNYEEFNNLVSDLTVIAHLNAIEIVRKAVDVELAKLYTTILEITKDIVADNRG